VILLSTPVDTIMKRLVARSSGGYRSTGDERRKVVELIATIEPLLWQCADHEIDTSGSVWSTVDEILRLT
jgi:shikimate kinase